MKKLGLAGFFPLLLVACLQSPVESSLSTEGGSGTEEGSFEAPIGGDIMALEVNGNEASLTVNDLGSEDEVILVLFSHSEKAGTQSFQIAPSLNPSNFLVRRPHGQANLEDQEEVYDETDLTEQWHDELREVEMGLEDEPLPEPELKRQRLPRTGKSKRPQSLLTRTLAVGTKDTFRVLNSFTDNNSFEEVTATLRYSGTYFDIYVDDNETGLKDEDIVAIGDEFAAVVPKEQAIFGKESDINGDGKFAVLFTPVVNKMGAQQGGMVTGFFYALDLFSRQKYPMSNEREMICALVPDPKGKFGLPLSHSFARQITKGVLPHEYQHMISFNQHYFVNGGSSEEAWLNEGLSHLAEDLYTLDELDFMAGFGLENPSRVLRYFAEIPNICFICGSNFAQRGGAYLFLKYLYEQAEWGNFSGVDSGNELLTILLDTNARGVGNVVRAVFGSEDKTLFKDLMGYFALAVYLSDTEYVTDQRFEITGIPLRGLVQDNRGSNLNGPAIQTVSSWPFTDTLKGSGITYLKIPTSLLKQNPQGLGLTLSGDASFGGYIVK